MKEIVIERDYGRVRERGRERERHIRIFGGKRWREMYIYI